MLYSADNGVFIKRLPHKRDYDMWRARLPDSDYNAIVDELNNRIDGNDIHTAGWMPGHDWTGTVFEPLYHACGRNIETAALFFGLIVYKVMMERPDYWGFGRYEKDGIPIQSMTYFKLNCRFS